MFVRVCQSDHTSVVQRRVGVLYVTLHRSEIQMQIQLETLT